ncbi:unnamed protein product [Chondrus crispus]|uniref:Uncharacterized protein n=1 Tax=Chondrus crispus TaxID=2769 RepID=R7QIZ0_CHOCR|nr:unnamed protein product [Chondrus crispus]CDF37390.1 unnamed protein product [Chondrus crispus]|eukprot:XP_005717209.1 unnamed protein product [Chondrus crispus]
MGIGSLPLKSLFPHPVQLNPGDLCLLIASSSGFDSRHPFARHAAYPRALVLCVVVAPHHPDRPRF